MTAPPLPNLNFTRQTAAELAALAVEAASDLQTVFRVRIEQEVPTGPWLVGDGVGVLLGAVAARHADRLDAMLAALDALEPFLDLVEAQTGWVMEPSRISDHPPADTVLLAVEARRTGETAAHFALAVPEAVAAAVTGRAVLAAERIAAVPLLCRMRAVAALLALEEAGGLAPGDLLILEPGPWRAVLVAEPLGETVAVFDPLSGRMGKVGGGLSKGDAQAAEQLRSFRVPVEVSLAAGSATIAELAALREGGSIALGPVTAGLSVMLSVGGRPLGTGELVQLGDRFAVVVDSLAAAPAASAADTGATD